MVEETRLRNFYPGGIVLNLRGSHRCNHRLFLLALGTWAVLSTSCTQPLGPGYRFAGRQTEIRVSGVTPEQVHIRVADHFTNVGDRPLRSLEVRLPEGHNSGAQTIRVVVDGDEVAPEQSSKIDRRMARAAFDPAWEQLEAREIVTEWDVMPEDSVRGTVAASATAFHIADQTAFPLWQSPNGIFTKGGPVPEEETLMVTAPADFRILAPGKLLKRSVSGNVQTQSFRIKPDEDFPPYVVAGKYEEQVIDTRQGDVNFLTLQPLDRNQAQTAAARLSFSMRTFTDFFGPATNGRNVIRVVETAGDLQSEYGEIKDAGGASFPQGVLLDSRAFARGIVSQDVLELVEYELARTWFGWRVLPRPEAQILMGRGMGLFSLVLAAEGRGQDQRGAMVASLVERYDKARQVAADRRLLEPPAGYSRAERISTGYRAALFFVALEDLCGRDNLRSALRIIVRSRGNDDVGHEELRSAVEFASQRDLAVMFRAWLIQPGIPEDFRARYSKPMKMLNMN